MVDKAFHSTFAKLFIKMMNIEEMEFVEAS